MIPRPVTGFREMKQSLFDIMATNLERSRLSQHGHTIRVVDTHRQRRLKLHGAGALYMTVSIKCMPRMCSQRKVLVSVSVWL